MIPFHCILSPAELALDSQRLTCPLPVFLVVNRSVTWQLRRAKRCRTTGQDSKVYCRLLKYCSDAPCVAVPEVVSTRFDVNQEIGSGAYGLVYKATDKLTYAMSFDQCVFPTPLRDRGETVALKRCMKVLSNKTDAHRTLREVASG